MTDILIVVGLKTGSCYALFGLNSSISSIVQKSLISNARSISLSDFNACL